MKNKTPTAERPTLDVRTRNREGDAVRYIVLRKLSAGMRHALMGELQAVQFATDLAAQLTARGATGTRLNESIAQISEQTKAATETSRSIIEWLQPVDGSRIDVDTAIQECLKLAGDVWILRGIRATTHCHTGGATVAKTALYDLLVTSLFALTELHAGSLDIDVFAEQLEGKVTVKLSARAADRMSAASPMPYGTLTFDDVGVLAAAHGISFSCTDASVTLEFEPSPV